MMGRDDRSGLRRVDTRADEKPRRFPSGAGDWERDKGRSSDEKKVDDCECIGAGEDERAAFSFNTSMALSLVEGSEMFCSEEGA